MDKEDQLLSEDIKRYVIFPIKNDEVWRMYKKAEANFWTTEELDLTKDLKDFNGLNEGERYFIENILAFFAASDGIVKKQNASTWANAENATAGNAVDTSGTTIETREQGTSFGMGSVLATIYRGFLSFDTSGISNG